MDSPITNIIERELTSIWCVFVFIIHRKNVFVQIALWLQKLQFVYKTGIPITKTAFRLQIFNYHFTKLHLRLQSGISLYNSASEYCFSGVKIELVQPLNNKKHLRNKANSGHSIYPRYVGMELYGKSRFLKIYISDTEAVLIENTSTITEKDMWAIFKDYMEDKNKKLQTPI